MKYLSLLIAGVIFYSCNHIPDKSIFEPLEAKSLAKIIERDTSFLSFYEELQKTTEDFNEIEKAKFNDITYRKLYSLFEFSRDTIYLNPLRNQWKNEWENEFGMYEAKCDSVINYWIQYKKNNSLNRFVKIEFAAIDKEYYSYSHDVKKVSFVFELTPLEGKIDQLCFNYRYAAKINNIQYAEKHFCITTSPFTAPVTRYWEAAYADEKKLKYTTTSEFRRDYDIQFEITELRKGGINYKSDELHIPKSVKKVFETDSIQYPYLYKYYKDEVITEILCPEYQNAFEFIHNRLKQSLREKFPKEVAFIDYANNK